jgi:hypothetical protein
VPCVRRDGHDAWHDLVFDGSRFAAPAQLPPVRRVGADRGRVDVGRGSRPSGGGVMTGRPRTWTLSIPTGEPCPDEPGIEASRSHSSPGSLSLVNVRAVEWDRERVVPIIQQAIADRRTAVIGGRVGCTCSLCLAEAVFDALGGGGA